MKSYTTLRNLYGTLTKNTSTANLTLGDELIMDEYRHMCAMKDFAFLHRLRTASTVASTTFVALPYDMDTVESVFVTVGSTRHNPKPAPSRSFWDRLHYTTFTSDVPEYWFVYNGEIGLWPQPATSSNTISLNGRVRVRDLNFADNTSITITTLANASTALTVSGSLTTQMTGFWIRPTFSTTANTGDGAWYELASVTNSTTATLVRKYGGASIAAGTAAMTLAQLPLLPEAYQDTPVYKAAAIYWQKETDPRADEFMSKYNNDMGTFISQRTAEDTSPVLRESIGDDGDRIINPNLTVQL